MGRVEHLLKPERAASDTADGPGRMMGVGVVDFKSGYLIWPCFPHSGR